MVLPRLKSGDRRIRAAALAVAAVVVLGWLAVLGMRPGSWLFAFAHRDEFRRSDIAIRAVEAFRREHGRLPESLAAAGLPPENETCPCYNKSGEQTYIVWFGWRPGGSVIYDSASGQWQYD